MKYVETGPAQEEGVVVVSEAILPNSTDGSIVVHPEAVTRNATSRVSIAFVAARDKARAAWRARRLWLGFAALGCALYGQKLLIDNHGAEADVMTASICWYAVGVALAIVAWWGSYRNKSCLLQPGTVMAAGNLPLVRAHPVRGATRWRVRLISVGRYALAFAALGINLFSANLLRADYYSAVGSFGWLASLLLLVVAFVGHRPRPGIPLDAGATDNEDRTDWRLPRNIEIAVFVGLCLVGLALRFYRLGDWTTGFHPDEGYAGTDASSIVSGHPVSPFLFGWYDQSNFYFWGIAAGLKLFGHDLFGVRFFSAAVGSLMIPFFYGLVRMWFGVRMAVIATFLLAFSDLALNVSKEEFSNSTTPVLLVIGFYFLFRGLRTRRTLNFVLAGYANVLSLYFYNGGRLAPFMLVALLLYLFALMPLVRLPGVYRALRMEAPGTGRLRSFGRAISRQTRGVFHYTGQTLALVIACICFASPFMAYYIDHTANLNSRSTGVMVFDQAESMENIYKAGHTPLYLGLRLPRSTDLYPVLPVAFEQTGLSVKLADDGFWPRVLWGQTTSTLSMLTYRHDGSGVYSVTADAIVKPIESALIVLGLAWALWRWRDTRMATISLWFWSTIIVGGVFTDQAPYMPRVVGIIPTLAILAAIPLNKLAGESVETLKRWNVGTFLQQRFNVSTFQRANFVVALAIAVLLAYIGYLDFNAYFVKHSPYWDDRTYTGQAFFVRDMNARVSAEGRPTPIYLDYADGTTWWGDGANRFLNYGTTGSDNFNVANDLPVTNNGGRDLVFMFWGDNARYLPFVQAYYPVGERVDYNWRFRPTDRDLHLLTYYRVKSEDVDRLRISQATYTSADGNEQRRDERGIGTTSAPPGGLKYPARSVWQGQLIAPAFARYNFRLAANEGSELVVDNLVVVPSAGSQTDGAVILAKGVHSVRLVGSLTNEEDKVGLSWSVGASNYVPVARRYLWQGPGRGLVGDIRLAGPDIHSEPLAEESVTQRRVDGAIGFRHAAEGISGGYGLLARWRGTLNISEAGSYGFQVISQGQAMLVIDGSMVIDSSDDDATTAHGTIDLAEGAHDFQLRYNWNGSQQQFDLLWQPPGQSQMLLPPEVLTTEGGAWQPGTVVEPPATNVDLGAP